MSYHLVHALLWIFCCWLAAAWLCGSLRFGDAQQETRAGLWGCSWGSTSAMGRCCCSDPGTCTEQPGGGWMCRSSHAHPVGETGIEEDCELPQRMLWERKGLELRVVSSRCPPLPTGSAPPLWDGGKGELQAKSVRCGSPPGFRSAPCTLKGTKSHTRVPRESVSVPGSARPPNYKAG